METDMKIRNIRIVWTLLLSFAPAYPLFVIGMLSQPEGWVSIVCVVALIGLLFVYPVWRLSKELEFNNPNIKSSR